MLCLALVLMSPQLADAKRTLVISNGLVAESVQLGDYYAKMRGIPQSNVIVTNIAGQPKGGEDAAWDEIDLKIVQPVRKKVKELSERIDYIVLMKGIPIRTFDKGKAFSVDSYVAAMNLNMPTIEGPSGEAFRSHMNPYFTQRERFSSAKYGFYLVTRLDGYTFAEARALVDRSIRAKSENGPFLLDAKPGSDNRGYQVMNDDLKEAADVLKAKKVNHVYDESSTFIKPKDPLMGYASWGSNDGQFNAETYQSIRWKPGAIAETFVSTSGRTFRPTSGGQSLIADLIKTGVTGVKGYVNEPYTVALARPSVLFERYTSGFNLAESFYMASPLLKWQDVVIGDPLCSPYRK